MNRSIRHTFLAATTACGLWLAPATAQTTATTDPVGAMTVTVPGEDDYAVAVPLLSTVVFDGEVLAVSGDHKIVVSENGSLSGDELIESPSYVLFTSGSNSGVFLSVVANTNNEVTLEDIGAGSLVSQGVKVGDRILIARHWTLDSLFPNGQGFPKSSNVLDPKGVLFFPNYGGTGVNRPFALSFIYHSGEQLPEGWYQSGQFGETVGDTVIIPDSYFVIRNLSSVEYEISLSGPVRMSPLSTYVNINSPGVSQDNYISFGTPVGTTLAASNLIESGAFEASENVLNPSDVLFSYNYQSVGFNKPFSESFIYHSGEQIPEGWYRSGQFSQTVGESVVLSGVKGYTIRKNGNDSPAGSVLWKFSPNFLN